MLTGARVTDISPAAQDAVLRDRAAEMMKRMGSSTFSKVYFPEEELAEMSPGRRAIAESLMQLQAQLASRAKERRQLASP